MSQFQQLDQLMERQDGMLRTGQALAAGISKPVFYQFVQSRGLEQAAHGIYLSKDAGWTPCICCIFAVRRQFFPMKRRCFSTT